MTEHDTFVEILLAHGYVEQKRVATPRPRTMGEPHLSISFLHPRLRWAHIAVFQRPKGNKVECGLHPQLLGERIITSDPAQVMERLRELERRAGTGNPTKVWAK